MLAVCNAFWPKLGFKIMFKSSSEILMNHKRGRRKGLRFCGNFYFKLRYCGFKTLSGLRLSQHLSRGFR